MRILDTADLISASSAPNQGRVTATALKSFADDASYVADKGAAAGNGDIYYNTTDDLIRVYRGGFWETVVTQPKVTGSTGSPSSITVGGGVAFTGKQVDNLIFVKGTGGVTVTANPAIAAGNFVGQKLRLIGTSDVDYLIFNDGNGLWLNGQVQLDSNRSIDLDWNGTVWREICRN